MKGNQVMKIKAVMLCALMLGSLLLSGCYGSGNSGGAYENNDGFFGEMSQSGDSSDKNTENSDNDNVGDNSDHSASSDDGEHDDDPLSPEDDDENIPDADGNGRIAEPASPNGDAARVGMRADNLRSTLIGWGLGKEKDSLYRPIDAVNAQETYGQYSSLFIDNSGDKVIYLTFDEGYENGYTSAILDTLKSSGTKAVFFVTYDYCRSAPDLVKRMIDEGHTVGNHSYSHPSFPKCSEKTVNEEVTLLHDYVKENFNYEMTLFRFPKGEFSEKTLALVQKLGYTSVFWSFAYQDWDVSQQPAASEAFETVTSATHSGGIFLLHAVSKANADALGDIIDYWKNNGYTVGDLNILAAKTSQ